MPNSKTDNKGFSTTNADQQRDIAGKGGPALGEGTPDNRHATSKPYNEDLQTQIAAKSHHKKQQNTNK